MRRVALIFKWILPIMLLILMLIFTNSRQSVQQVNLHDIVIQASDHKFIDKQIVLNYLEKNSVFFDSVSVTDFKTEDLETLLESHPVIKEAEIFVNQKGNVEVSIMQKKAIVRVKSDSGDYYLDEFGSMMQLFDNYTEKLVVATGDILFDDHIEIYNFISKINTSDFWSKQITQIHFEGDEILLIPRVGDQKISIGSFDNILERLDNLYQFYKVAMPLKGWQSYSRINLKFNNQIVCVRK